MIIFIKTLPGASPVLNACFICTILFNQDYRSTREVALALFVIWKQNESEWIGQSLKDKNSKTTHYSCFPRKRKRFEGPRGINYQGWGFVFIRNTYICQIVKGNMNQHK